MKYNTKKLVEDFYNCFDKENKKSYWKFSKDESYIIVELL